MSLRGAFAVIVLLAVCGLAIVGASQVITTRTAPLLAATEKARMLNQPVPKLQGQYQVLLLEAGDRMVRVRTYCYQGNLLFTTEAGELRGVAAGGCAWKSR